MDFASHFEILLLFFFTKKSKNTILERVLQTCCFMCLLNKIDRWKTRSKDILT